MKNVYCFLNIALVLITFQQVSFGQSIVFSDDFNRASLSPGGSPSTTYTPTNTGTGTGVGSSITTNFLQITGGSASVTAGVSYITGPLSAYSSPFNTILSSNTGVITWTVNARTNRGSTLNGFNSGQYGIAVILAADNTNMLSADGYAIAYGGSAKRNYRLVKFAGGLASNSNITDIITSGANDFSNTASYVSLRITYNPANNVWQFFSRDDGTTSWSDPSSGVTTQIGSDSFDNTYTSTAMSVFGFFWNYNTNNNQFAQIDNFTVSCNTPSLYVSPSSISFGNQNLGSNSTAQTFNITGFNLTGSPGNITVTASNTDFQVSNDNNTWSSSATIAYSSATLSSTPVYIRFTPQATGARPGNITFSGGGVLSPPTITLSGTGAALANNEFETTKSGNWNDTTTWIKGLSGSSVSFTNGSTAVTGTGTSFTSQLSVGDALLLQASSGIVMGTVSSITNNTNLVLTAVASATASGPYGKQASPTSADGVITILQGHTVTVTANVTADQITVNQGGQITVNNGITFTINNGSGIDLTINGIVQDDGIITGANTITINSTGTVNVTNTFNLTAGNPVLTINSGGTLNLTGTAGIAISSTSSLDVSGTLAMSGSSTISVTRGNSGTTAQILAGGLITMSGTAQISVNGNVNNNMEVFSGGTLDLGAATKVTGTGGFALDNGATIKIGSVDGISASGTNTGNIQSTGGTRSYGSAANYIYDGTSIQNSGNGLPATVNNLSINNSGGSTGVSLNNGGVAVTDSLTLTNGLLTSSSTNLLALNNGSAVSGGSNTSFVNGPVQKIGNTTFTFPVGKSSVYAPISISAPSNTTDAFTAEYMIASAKALGPITASGLVYISECEYWKLDRTAGASAVNVTLSWNSSSICNSGSYITDLSTLVVAHFNGTSWDNFGNDGGYTGNTSAGTVTWNNVSTFSPFSFGSTSAGANPLPIKFDYIKATELNSHSVQIEWRVLTEENVSHYEIESSLNGQYFTTIGQVTATGNNSSAVSYSWLDMNFAGGVVFYRIKSVDFDNEYTYSNIIMINGASSGIKGFLIYPDPVTGNKVSILANNINSGKYAIQIFDNIGRNLYNQTFDQQGGAFTQIIQLPGKIIPGIYTMWIVGSHINLARQFMVK